MQLTKTAGAIVIGGLLIGCQNSHPKASAPAGASLSSSDEQTAAELQRTYRASHPGTQVGYVNAVDPSRRIVSVGGIPSEQVRIGSIMSILTKDGGTVQAVVYDHAAGYVQLRYETLGPGQSEPVTGELAVWNPGGNAVIPEAVQPPGGVTTPISPAVVPAPPPPPVNTNTPPESIPAAPASRPAEIPPTTETPPPTAPPATAPATAPESRPAPDFGK